MALREKRIDEGDIAGHEPTEEVGPEECEPDASEAEFKAGSLDEKPDASHPKFSEELMDSFAPEPDVLIAHPIDGMPVPADERSSVDAAFAPPFTYDTVVCIEDDRQWVERFDVFNKTDLSSRATLVSSVVPTGNDRAWCFERRAFQEDGTTRAPFRFDPDQVIDRWGIKVVKLPLALLNERLSAAGDPTLRGDPQAEMFLFVEPIRPRCLFYKRQNFSNDAVTDPNAAGHHIVFRNCEARRSVGGAMMSLRDEAIYACDHRQPRDPASEKKWLDDPDLRRLQSKDHLVHLPLFKTEEK